MDDERLKQIKHFGQDYFDELLERIFSSYLDLAESRAKNRKIMNMKDWEVFFDAFFCKIEE